MKSDDEGISKAGEEEGVEDGEASPSNPSGWVGALACAAGFAAAALGFAVGRVINSNRSGGGGDDPCPEFTGRRGNWSKWASA